MTMPPEWLAALVALVGAEHCEVQAARLQDYAVDGQTPCAVVWPQSMEQVAAVLQWAQHQKLAVLPRGSGTKIRLGGIPKRLDIVLSLRRLAVISEYDVANFTVTAGAGTTCAQLAHLTAAHQQTLALQYPFSAATLGGLIGANAYNPKRLLYGGVRDQLLGVRIALSSGELVHFGGKVVKNVAGYDMCKLFLGSVGAFGVIVEATFKLSAVPERDETFWAAFPSLAQGEAAVTRVLGTQLLPAQILLLNSSAARAIAPAVGPQVVDGETLLLVNCEGMDEAVERQLTDLTRLSQGHGASSVGVLSGEGQLLLRRGLQIATCYAEGQMPTWHESSTSTPGEDDGGAVAVRLGTLPSRVAGVMEAVSQMLQATACTAMVIGDCGVGMVRICLKHGHPSRAGLDEALRRMLPALPGLVVSSGGYAVVESAPPEVKAQLDVWGPPPSSFALLKALKRRFDPEDTLSPGRFIGGL